MTPNSWMEHAPALAAAYDRHNQGVLGRLRQSLLYRGLEAHLPPGPQRVVDVGGGEGYQAVALARSGHHVVLLDPDPAMLAAARERLAAQEKAVRQRVELVRGYGEDAADLTGGGFDVVCCHGILMYLDDPTSMLNSVVALARPGGLISVLAKNADAAAMRPALEGRWADAIETLETGVDRGAGTVRSRAHTVEGVSAALTAAGGVDVLAWYGLRVFSDHLGATPVGPDFDQLCALEWIAGCRDPYRRVARLFHVIARRLAGRSQATGPR
jgi:ubiquinone/menaquinone biosynthesis C-methylase UbiE